MALHQLSLLKEQLWTGEYKMYSPYNKNTLYLYYGIKYVRWNQRFIEFIFYSQIFSLLLVNFGTQTSVYGFPVAVSAVSSLRRLCWFLMNPIGRFHEGN